MTPTPLGRWMARTDLLGHALRAAAPRDFKGRGRLTRWWRTTRARGDVRTRTLPGGGRLDLDLAVPYEAHVWLGIEEPRDLDVLGALLRPGDAVIDCGANLGLWTLTAAARVGPEGAVLAVEANPQTAARLRAHVAQSGFANTTVAEVAAGDAGGTVAFVCEPEHNISHVAEGGDSGTVAVTQARLDDLVAESLPGRPVAFVKVDVEGRELAVLQGAAALVEASRPLLCVEFNTEAAGARTLAAWDVHALLTAWGYQAYRFLDALDPAPRPVDPEERMTGYLNLLYRP